MSMPAAASSDDRPPPVLLGYQQRFLASAARVRVWEKSRRIGASWGVACDAVTVSAASRAAGGMDTLYIGYNLEMAREFIGDCAFWARHLGAFTGAVPEIQELLWPDRDETGERSIQAFRIRFASGFEVVALSSRPRSLRGKQGFVVVDEAAFHEDLRGLLKAALALLIWGGRVAIISTHEGADNPFAELVEDCRAGRKPYELHRTTFREAVAEGLYRRVCLRQGIPWSAEGEAAWVEGVYADYGDAAAEELDVVPSQGSGVWLTRAVIDACSNPGYRVLYLACKEGFELEPDHARRAWVEAWLAAEVAPQLARLDREAQSFLGADFARSGDLTVIWAGQMRRGDVVLRVPLAVELRNMPFADQRFALWWLIDKLPRFAGAALDARGLGAQLAEETMQRYGASRIQRVMASRAWYLEHMPPLKARFEDRTIEVPRDDDTRADLRAVVVDKGVPVVPEGVRVRSTRGGWRHGDAAIAAAMLHAAAAAGSAVAYGYEAAPRAAGLDVAMGDDESEPRWLASGAGW